MSGGYKYTSADPIEALAQKLTDLQTQIRELQRPTGTQIANAVATLTDLVNNMQAQIDSLLATAVNTGDVNATGHVNAGGSMNAGGTISGDDLKTAQGPTRNITAARVAAWLQNSDGLIGTATSSRRFKSEITAANLDVQALLSLEPKHYRYTAEVEKGREDPEYHVQTEIGLIAEDLHEAGLWEFVIYEADRETPWGIHYPMLTVGLLAAARTEARARSALEARLSALEQAQGL